MNPVQNPPTNSTIGILHPGQMGVTIATALASAGHIVHWTGQERSAATRKRAVDANLRHADSLQALCEHSQFVFCVCPPDQACVVADQVADAGFNGTYVDCNAVSPTTALQVASTVSRRGAHCVDGGIIGPPAVRNGTTRLYLSGASAPEVAALFQHSLVETRVIGTEPGAASALKMAYAGWTKGSMALLMTQFALARQQNVDSALMEEWALSQPGLADKLTAACTGSAPKAWRFIGEMNEIADTLENAGLSRLWFDGAADTYARLDTFRNQQDVDPQDVFDALLHAQAGNGNRNL